MHFIQNIITFGLTTFIIYSTHKIIIKENSLFNQHVYNKNYIIEQEKKITNIRLENEEIKKFNNLLKTDANVRKIYARLELGYTDKTEIFYQ